MPRAMLAGPVPAGRGGQGGRQRTRWGVVVSAVLHLLALAAVLLLTRRPPSVTEDMAPSYQLMFEGGGSTPSTSPDRGDSGPPARQQTESEEWPTPPQPAPPQAPPVQPAPEPRPAPEPAVPPAVPPSPAATAPAEPAPPGPLAPPQEAPPAPDTAVPPAPPPAAAVAEPPLPDLSGADIRLQPPAPPAPAPPMVPDLTLPPPPPLPLPPPALRPAPPRPRTAPSAGTFANPMDLSFNQAPRADRQAAPRAGAAPGSVASRSMDFSLGAPKAGANRSEAFFDARARNLGADWMQGVKAFWLRHRYYPRQAAENGEDGDVDLELTVDRTGRVQSAVVTSKSGSAWIDMAAVGTFRGAQLPPLPDEVTAPYKTTITIHYMLIR